MTDATPASREVTRYTLAIGDLSDVSWVARLIARDDPDLRFARRIGEIGLEAAVSEAEARPRSTRLPGDWKARLMLETGLIVTYARPFTKGRGSGFPIPDRFVPREKWKLHDMMLDLRNKVYAHIDASGPEGFQRRVLSYEAKPDGGEHDETRGPRLLGEDDLLAVADLADDIIDRLKAARRAAYTSQKTQGLDL